MPSHPFREAVENRDLDAMIGTLAPDVVFHSPLVSAPFRGQRQVGELFRLLSELFLFKPSLRYTHEVANADTVFLSFEMEVDGVPVEGVDLLLLDAQGKVRDITVFLRPLPGTSAVARALSPKIAATEGPAQAALASAGSAPLFALARVFDAVASRMVSRGALGGGG